MEKRSERKIEKSVTKAEEVFVAELDDYKAESENENDFYTSKELENQTMAYIARKFENLKFRKYVKYKFKGSSGKF